MRGIEERRDYHQYIHDQYFVIMLGFNYLTEYNRLKIINDMAIIKYLQPLYQRLCCFFKLILKKQYHNNQLPLIEFQEYQSWQRRGRGGKPSWFMADDAKAMDIMSHYKQIEEYYK